MSVYPAPISETVLSAEFSGACCDEDAFGKSASFICGCFARFSLHIEPLAKHIEDIRFTTNGCGYAVAAAETLARGLQRSALTDLRGTNEIDELIDSGLGVFPIDRIHCAAMAVEALRAALANYREGIIEEFQGEKSLICTCFGVSEETITKLILENRIRDMTRFSDFSNAGTGCGSCQILIQELIDAARN